MLVLSAASLHHLLQQQVIGSQHTHSQHRDVGTISSIFTISATATATSSPLETLRLLESPPPSDQEEKTILRRALTKNCGLSDENLFSSVKLPYLQLEQQQNGQETGNKHLTLLLSNRGLNFTLKCYVERQVWLRSYEGSLVFTSANLSRKDCLARSISNYRATSVVMVYNKTPDIWRSSEDSAAGLLAQPR
ncbi:hypothetical protein ElyMa_003234500 [Elysia marginata]|uniref:Uncharacterized protein n=1 Tax=Elysia marginata TaxID=1093978 RepID=A0AAV4J9L1_9GAST|nr:hypothetical protein ElyMa_003234500 [Elysia marginata]